MRMTGVFILSLFLVSPGLGTGQSKEQERLAACGETLKEILDIPDGLPRELLNGTN